MLDKLTIEWVKWALPMLNEAQTRWFLAKGADLIGRGGITELSEISGVHRHTISTGLKEIISDDFDVRMREASLSGGNIRLPGGGRKPITERYPTLLEQLEEIVSPSTYQSYESTSVDNKELAKYSGRVKSSRYRNRL